MIPLVLLGCVVADPLATTLSATSDAGLYVIEAGVTPDPPQVGASTLAVWAEGAETLGVDGTMVAMGHGFGEEPVITALGEGEWEIAATWSMSGTWEVTFALGGPLGPDTARWTLDVE